MNFGKAIVVGMGIYIGLAIMSGLSGMVSESMKPSRAVAESRAFAEKQEANLRRLIANQCQADRDLGNPLPAKCDQY